MKEDEAQMWKELWRQKREGINHPMIVEIGEMLGINEKRINYIAEKWYIKGLINCGVSARTGWIEQGITEDSLK